MPTYEYVCKNCGHSWEVEQRISADPITECPSCHEPKAQRQISGGNFILKGGGWYADLYSSSPSKSAKSETKTDATNPATKSDAPKTETKTDTKAAETTAKPTTSTEKK